MIKGEGEEEEDKAIKEERGRKGENKKEGGNETEKQGKKREREE